MEGLEHPEGGLVREGSIGRLEHRCERGRSGASSA